MRVCERTPPMIWCRCGDGVIPGFTSGSTRSITSCEHENRMSAWAGVAANANAVKDFQSMLTMKPHSESTTLVIVCGVHKTRWYPCYKQNNAGHRIKRGRAPRDLSIDT